jgi:hypothetical protein
MATTQQRCLYRLTPSERLQGNVKSRIRMLILRCRLIVLTYIYPCRPQFPRAKINGTPDGLTSVHIGVRPRAPGAPAAKHKGTALSGPAFPETGETRNAGKGKASAESRIGSGIVDLGKRREGYGEVHSDIKDGSSTVGSDHSGFSRRDDHRQESSRHAAPIQRSGEKQESSRHPERAVPRMTLQEAVEQWDKNHPNTSRSSSHRDGIGGTDVGDTGMLEESSDLGDDGRSHDGIYTYDYSGLKDSARLRSKASSSNTRLNEASSFSTAQVTRMVVHVDGTEGPVRVYPRPPEHENSYGVPFGKRLKALIQMRKEAEENGLVASSVGEDGMLMKKGRTGARDLVRRPAVTSRESALHPKDHNSPSKAGRAKPASKPPGVYAQEPDDLESDVSDATPTRRQTRAAAPSPQTPARPTSHRLRRPSSAHAESQSPSADRKPKSTILPPESVATKSKRKPVPRYIGDTTSSHEQASEPNDPHSMSIRKHKSESSFRRDPSEAEKDRKGHQRGAKSPKKRYVLSPCHNDEFAYVSEKGI